MLGMPHAPVHAARQSAPSRITPDPVSAPSAVGATGYALVSQIGVELSLHANTMRQIVQDFTQNHQVSDGQLLALKAAVESANDIARQSQQIARLAQGRLRQSHERIRLDELVHQTAKERMAALQPRGVHCTAI